jgi:hypothetical protein
MVFTALLSKTENINRLTIVHITAGNFPAVMLLIYKRKYDIIS